MALLILKSHKSLQCARAWPTPPELCSALFSIHKGKRARSAGSAAASPTPGTDPAAAPIPATSLVVANTYTSMLVPTHIYLHLHILYICEYKPYILYMHVYICICHTYYPFLFLCLCKSHHLNPQIRPCCFLGFLFSAFSRFPLGRGTVSKQPCGAEPPSMSNHSTALSP